MSSAFVSFVRMVRIGAITVVAVFASTAALAQDDYARNGVYLGLAGTFAFYTEADDEIQKELAALGYAVKVGVDDPFGLNTRVGYRAHPRFAAEGEFEWLSEADVSFSGPGLPTTDLATIDNWILTANAKGYALTGRVQPFGLVGVGFMQTELSVPGLSQSEGGFAARFGGGVDVYITSNIVGSLDITYVLPTGNIDAFDYVSIGWGFGYRF